MLNKREKIIAIVTILVVAGYLLDYLVISQLLQIHDDLHARQDKLQKELAEGQHVLRSSLLASRRWRDFRAAGLGSDPSNIESHLLNDLRTWSADSNLTLTSLRPDRASENKDLIDLTFQATAEGSMHAIWNFIYRLETAPFPLRIREMQITTRTQSSDSLALDIRLSVIWESKNAKTLTSNNQPSQVNP